jgi:DNA-binding MarR family transcriptional regulator
MESMGWIERRPDEHDKRMMRVYLTETGVTARREARDLIVTVNERLRQLLGADSVDRLLIEMKRLNEVLDQPQHLLAKPSSTNKPHLPRP